MTRPLRVLIVGASPPDADRLLLELRQAGYAPLALRVASAEELEAALTADRWDVVLADQTLPGFGAPEALALLQRRSLDLPLIIVSGTIQPAQAVEMMRAGARDYLTKGDFI